MMAVAKKWKFEMALGMSTWAAKLNGLPLSRDSAATNSSMRFLIPSDSLINISLRSSLLIADQIGKAFSALSTAKATSFSSEFGIKEYTFPVAGS